MPRGLRLLLAVDRRRHGHQPLSPVEREAGCWREPARPPRCKRGRICIVASGRGPSDREVDHVASVVVENQARNTGSMSAAAWVCCRPIRPRLKEAGVDRINHNLNTSRRFYGEICSTHSFDDRIETSRIVRDAGMELCCGLIVGMGEHDDDVVDVALSSAKSASNRFR